jgi:hypothetical protein
VQCSCLFTRWDLLGDGKAFSGALENFAVFVALGIAHDLAFECFDGVLQASTSSRMILAAVASLA